MSERISTRQVAEAVERHRIWKWTLASCDRCQSDVCYLFDGRGNAWAVPHCRCAGPVLKQPSSYGDLADFFNAARKETRAALWARFLASGSAPPAGLRRAPETGGEPAVAALAQALRSSLKLARRLIRVEQNEPKRKRLNQELRALRAELKQHEEKGNG